VRVHHLDKGIAYRVSLVNGEVALWVLFEARKPGTDYVSVGVAQWVNDQIRFPAPVMNESLSHLVTYATWEIKRALTRSQSPDSEARSK
jgi:hypothetical protein